MEASIGDFYWISSILQMVGAMRATPEGFRLDQTSGSQLWQNQPVLHRLKYASPLSQGLQSYFKRCNPLACRVTSR
jgi:hypothetical protein